MYPVEPDAVRFGSVRVLVRQRAERAAVVPFLAGDGAGVSADAGVEVDDEAEFARAGFGQSGHGQKGQKRGIRYIDSAQNRAISGMPAFMKSVKR